MNLVLPGVGGAGGEMLKGQAHEWPVPSFMGVHYQKPETPLWVMSNRFRTLNKGVFQHQQVVWLADLYLLPPFLPPPPGSLR